MVSTIILFGILLITSIVLPESHIETGLVNYVLDNFYLLNDDQL